MTYILKNWSIIEHRSTANNKYIAPELRVFLLRGYVYGHPKWGDHHPITTSPIIDTDMETRIVTTRSAHKYKLERPDKNYKNFVKKNNPDWKYKELLEWSEDK